MTETKHQTYRYAIYFAPGAHDPWWEQGKRWLGRCALTGETYALRPIAGLANAQFAAVTQAPRRYGWHATLKAPFALAAHASLQSLRAQLQSLCQQHHAFTMPPLQLQRLGDFLALTPSQPAPALQRLADACVTELEPLALPLPAAELQRRRGAGLSATQENLLQRWGYPYVLEEFQFHMSLTGSLSALDAPTIEAIAQAADASFAGLPPLRCESLALFAEPTRGADFVLLEHFPLAPAS